MSLTGGLVLSVLAVAAAAAYGETNVVFEDSLPEHIEPSPPWLSQSDVFLQTAVLGLYNATLGVDRSLTNLNAVDHESDRNVIVSPASIAAAVSLMLVGAGGQTKVELGKLFGIDEHTLSNSTDADDSQNFKKLGTLLNGYRDDGDAPGGAHASLAKAVFLPRGHPQLSLQYRTAVKDYLNGELINVDFAMNGPETINRWVSVHTRGKINDIMQNTPPPDTKAVVVSALYFTGEWETPFFANYTKPKPFYYESNSNTSTNKNPIYVNMMIGNSEVFYYKNDELKFKAIGLPYKGNEYTAYFVLPNGNISLRGLMSTINERTLKTITESTTLTDITYLVPKMTLKSFTNLKPVLQKMEIDSVFDSSKANLSKMGLGSDFYVSDILHKVEIVIDEIGTVASAATVVTITRGGNPTFNVNKPFLFFIHHRLSDTILFWASINKPTPYLITPPVSAKTLKSQTKN
ncbi:Hypothetical protein CINCED_3A002316 [Cinara cedri]|uniref:Serpin domain-containing protein n=1 Tax=Cinara cedri TaxID=506608 RepID=A0A5E4N517_9HEMI|nr:Hypothetical protein CINCED_3A002316 [Cinara cedri]